MHRALDQFFERRHDVLRREKFYVQETHLFWGNEKAPSVEAIRYLTPERVINAQTYGLTEATCKELVDSRVLVSPGRSSKKELQFFVFLSYPGDSYVSEMGITQRLKAFLLRQTAISGVSAYSGLGFTRHLIKGVTTNYFEILKFVDKLSSEFVLLPTSTNTVIVADEEPFESDRITFMGPVAEREEQEVKSLVPELFSPDSNLQLYERTQLAKKVLELRPAFELDREGVLGICFAAIIRRDEHALGNRVLRSLTETEKALRDSLVPLARLLFGNGTQAALQDVNQSFPLQKGQKASFGILVNRCRHLLSQSSPKLAEELLPNSIFGEAAMWRNKIAHGDQDDVLRDWSEVIEFMAGFIPARAKLIEYFQSKMGV